MRENFANFATSTLVSPSPLPSNGTSFSVTPGQGALFPLSNFVICMDTEEMLIASRTNDTFTVATGGRGFDGTLASTHTANSAIVQLSWCRYNITHIWGNLADSYHPEVPPFHLGNTPSAYDNEFENSGSWVLAPSAATGTVFSAGTPVSSHLTFIRGFNDFGLYTAYIPFPVSSAFTVTCKISDGTTFLHTNTSDQTQFHLFVTDQSNPSGSPDGGNRFRIDCLNTVNIGASTPTRGVRVATDVSGVYSQLGPLVPLSPGMPLWLRITYDGAGNWVGYFGDGYIYWSLATRGGPFLTAPQSLGVSYSLYDPSGQWMQQNTLVDYVRIALGTVLPPYAN